MEFWRFKVKKKEIKDLAKKELSRLSFPGDWMTNELEEDGDSLRRSFRNSDYYTSRDGEEDDDWPDFTGQSEALAKATRHFSQEVLDFYNIEVYDEGEKSWFAVELTPKKK